MKNIEDTVCALSTPPGHSGIALIRLSGGQSHEIVEKVFQPKTNHKPPMHRFAVIGSIIDYISGEELDEGVVTCYRAPNSYTGEDMAEFSIHGNPAIINALLELLCSLGARLAEPGEFTLRAFLNQKMDLTQAEAVHDIISAKTIYQAQIAGRQRSGNLALQLRATKELLIDIIVNLESAIEFADQELTIDSRAEILKKMDAIDANLRQWIDSYRRGRIIHDGIRMAIIGRPNVGKSSLFNRLLEQNRSIVTDIPGTTRDTVSEYMSLKGVPIHLLDTAGIHRSEDAIEKMGIERSEQAISEADIILFVVDSGREASELDFDIKKGMPSSRVILVFNKCDLPCRWLEEEKQKLSEDGPFLEVSSKTGMGMDDLRSYIMDTVLGKDGLPVDGILVTNLRHCQALEQAAIYLKRAACSHKESLSEEFVLFDLHKCLECLGEITGETHVEDLLDAIFSKFCIGK
jgi:tRNA modification GTPase